MTQPEHNPLELQVDSALAEYMQQCDAGEVPDREAFLERHAALREELSQLLSAADWIEDLAGPTLADLSAWQSSTADEQPRLVRLPEVKVGHDAPETTLNRGLQTGEGIHGGRQTESSEQDETLSQPWGPFSPTLAEEQTLPLNKLGISQDFSLDESDASAVELSQPALPCRFGDYMLERVLGRGGMGVVYYGRQVRLDRPVAVKMIRSGALASQEEVVRFYAEARSAARLDHPNIVTVYQCGECEGHRYFSMDYVPGTDLARMIQDGPLDGKRAARYVRDAARAIQYAHDRGILHRDLKPANVLVDENDQVRITDFGLAKSIDHDTGLTATGAALGTPSYMSPEQAAGRVDEHHHATDVYALGAVLFTVVTGKPPFRAGNTVQTIMQVIHRPAPRARAFRAEVAEDLETIIDVCLQKAPERRYPSAGALADDLDRYLRGSPIHARPASNLRRAWYWLLGIPIVGAVLDNRVVEPTDAHRWVQRGLISVALMFLLVWFAVLIPTSVWYRNRMPSTVRIAAGPSGGGYDTLGRAIAEMLVEKVGCEAVPLASAGSSENVERLEAGEVELALLQGDVLGSPQVAVVAPLYYEAVHVLIKRDAEIAHIEALAGRRLLVGAEKSGVRSVANLLLGRAGLSLSDVRVYAADWRTLKQAPASDAAIVVTRPGDPELVDLLCHGEYQLLPIADSLQFAMDEPVFHAQLLRPEVYPDCGLPLEGVPTVVVTAFLATRSDAANVLVESVLHHLFEPQMVESNAILSAQRAAHWTGQAWHPAAREFFAAYLAAH